MKKILAILSLLLRGFREGLSGFRVERPAPLTDRLPVGVHHVII